MHTTGRTLARVVALVTFPLALSAQVFNGGLPAGYVCSGGPGTCGTSGPNGVVTAAPLGGTQFGYVTTANAVTQDPLGIANTTNGTTLLSNPFAATAGQSLSFSFNYVTSDGSENFPDYAFVRLLGAGSPSVLFTARTTTTGNTVPGHDLPGLAPGVTLTPSSTPIISTGFVPDGAGPVFAPLGDFSGLCFDIGCGYTGWTVATYLVAVTGDYQLQFGVFNANDEHYDSALAFDFASGAGGTPVVEVVAVTPTPEPASATLVAIGLLGVYGVTRRRRVVGRA
jgi:hypothetical protein